jgi:hypothetical protein
VPDVQELDPTITLNDLKMIRSAESKWEYYNGHDTDTLNQMCKKTKNSELPLRIMIVYTYC